MKTNRSLLLGLAVALSLGLSLLSYFARPATGQPAKPELKFEYCTLCYDLAQVSYVGPDKSFIAKGWGELNKKLGGEQVADVVGVMNILGRQGWELVAVETKPKSDAGTAYWYFKRPK